MEKTVAQLLDEKGRNVISVHPGDSVMQALSLMTQMNVGALVVMDGDKLAGIFSERDFARKQILYGNASANTIVSQLMTAQVVTAKPGNTLDECMAIMTERRFRHMPVVDGEKVIGVISATDLIRESISMQDLAAEQLR
jgi:CBS domain-containing protein